MTYLLDDFKQAEQARFGTHWMAFSDQVMGGCSDVRLRHDPETGLQLRGSVSLQNQGGFIQAALPLVHSRHLFDARHFEGVHIRCLAPQPGSYFVHLRSKELSMPWQHYRASLPAEAQWQTLQVPFSAFEARRTNHPLNLAYLTRIAVVAAGFAGPAELWLSEIGFY
ncbi:MAG: CIA30 family protein [Candidatus Sericytochromatia bacterium]|nr:CIA30 family protein [Candidatus Sericytochromatia bacterium]